VRARFFHESQILREPEISNWELSELPFIWGSEKVCKILFDVADPRLLSHKIVPAYPASFSWVIETAVKFIRAFSEPEAREIDPQWCRGIGGRIHVAKITPAKGFEWVPGFEPITLDSSV
jgi:hypothetical protein